MIALFGNRVTSRVEAYTSPSDQYSIIAFRITDSVILEIWLVRLTDRYFSALFLCPFLSIGVTFARCQPFGITPSSSDFLISIVKGVLISVLITHSIRGDVL